MVRPAPSSFKPRRALFAGVCAAAGLVIVVGGLALYLRPAAPPAANGAGLTLVVSGDTQGWISPCGCTANQSGGLPRRATYLAGLRQTNTVVYADAGGAIDGQTPYHKLKAQAIFRGEQDMQVAAHNIGAAELALGQAALQDLQQSTGIPLLSANVRTAAGTLFAQPFRIVIAGGVRVAFIGILAQKFAAGTDFTIDDPRQSALAAIQSLAGKYDRLIVLAYMEEADLDVLARALPEADAIIGGPTGQSIAPHRVGGGSTLVGSATRKGKFVLEAPLGQSQVAGRIVDMNASFADAAGQIENIALYRRELGQHDFSATAAGLAPAAQKLGAVAGSESCQKCHAADSALWSASAHAGAWAVLSATGAQVDPSCQLCHTTGYGAPGGFATIAASANRLSVGCEDCHGPSQAHVQDPHIHTPFLAAAQCITCHDEENSPTFSYNTFWAKIRHGQPASPAALPEAQP